MKKLTPNLIVDRIEDCLPFWVERLGFSKTVEVPEAEGGAVGFVILAHGSVELMLQSRGSMLTDVAELASGAYRSALYLEVDDLAPIRQALTGWPLVVPERTTFYGARELIVREPAGNIVCFAAHSAPAA